MFSGLSGGVGVRGPIPKSAEQREYEGGAAHRPMPAARCAGALGRALDRPKGMPAAARKLWDFYTEQMALQGTLRPIDAPGLETICLLHADLQQLEREKRRLVRQRKQQAKVEGRKIAGGALIEFEMTKEARRLQATITSHRGHLKQLCDRYGLNPIAGSRLQSVEGGIAPPLAASALATETSEVEQLIN